jgi:death-on-curing protein
VRYLDLADVRAVATAVLDGPMEVRDWGLLESALARPRASAFGEDAYPTLFDKAAAMLSSIVRNHALVDGNKRLGLSCAVLLLHKNGAAVVLDEDDAYDTVIAAAEGTLDVPELARCLRGWARPAAQ